MTSHFSPIIHLLTQLSFRTDLVMAVRGLGFQLGYSSSQMPWQALQSP